MVARSTLLKILLRMKGFDEPVVANRRYCYKKHGRLTSHGLIARNQAALGRGKIRRERKNDTYVLRQDEAVVFSDCLAEHGY